MYSEMQIYAYRDRIRISRKTSQGMEAYFRFFLSIFPTDFEHINDSQCKKINKLYKKYDFFLKKLCVIHFIFYLEYDLTVKIAPSCAP